MHTAAEIAEQYAADLDGLGELIGDLATIYGQAGGSLYIGLIRHTPGTVVGDGKTWANPYTDNRNHLVLETHLQALGLYADERTCLVDADCFLDAVDNDGGGHELIGRLEVTPRPVPSDVMEMHEHERLGT